MNRKQQLKIVESIGELNISQYDPESVKLEVIQNDDLIFDILFFIEGNRCILYRRLILNNIFLTDKDSGTSSFIISDSSTALLWKVLYIPFPMLELVNANKSIWAVGKKFLLDIKSYIQYFSVDTHDEILPDDFEDFERSSKVKCNKSEFFVNIPEVEKCELLVQDEKFCMPSNMIAGNMIVCHKDDQRKCWSLQLISVETVKLKPFINYIPMLSIPIVYDCEQTEDFKHDREELNKPVLVFLGSNDINSSDLKFSKCILKKLYGNNVISSRTCLCLIGHLSGKVLFSICNYTEYKEICVSSSELQLLYDMKQPISGIHFLEKLGDIRDCGFLLIVGAFGKIVVLSAEKIFKNSSFFETNKLSFWIVSSYVHSHIADHIMFNESMIHTSKSGKLWITDFLISQDSASLDQELNFNSEVSEFTGITKIVALHQKKGLVLLIAASGNLYIAEYKKKDTHDDFSSVPLLMNECLQQSTIMQHLLTTKSFQSRIFSALTTFSSIKYYGCPVQEKIAISVTEVHTCPAKFLLDIDFKCLVGLNLDPDLWHITATICTYFQNAYTVVSKTMPFNSNQMTLCIEVSDTVLQPSYLSSFPVYAEVGLILLLPEKWKDIECFEFVKDKLPMYLQMQRFLLNELHFIKRNTKFLTNCRYYDSSEEEASRNLFQNIYDLSLKKPFSTLFTSKLTQVYQFPQQCTFTLSAESVQEIMGKDQGTDKCQYCLKLLLGENLTTLSKDSYMMYKNHPVSITAAENEGSILLAISAKPFGILLSLRMSAIELLISNQKTSSVKLSYVSIPSYINRKCEEMAKSLISMHGQDVASDDYAATILKLYHELRREISEKLFIL